MDSHIGEKEIRTQKRLIGLFEKRLGYTVLGDWKDRENSNLEEKQLKKYLKKKGYSDSEITKAITILKRDSNDLSDGLYQANLRVYNLLRYGVNILPEVGEQKKYIHLIDWNNPHENDFYIAEEVTIKGREKTTKRPDLVIYVNGIAFGVIELKRCTSSVHNGIRQNLDNQKDAFIPHFFTTMQFLFAGNDTEGLYYGVIDTPEKFWLRWKESNPEEKNELDRSILQVFDKDRFLELIHDFIIFDGGRKKACRPNQYFGVKAAQPRARNKESGIIWHSQGSGKSLTMVWLARWIHENIDDARVIIITDRDELDKQIENAFKNAGEEVKRAKSGYQLIGMLNNANPWLICTLIHKFGKGSADEEQDLYGRKRRKPLDRYLEEVANSLPADFKAKGNLYVFVDECHRTQGGYMHEAMKKIMGDDVMLVGFTGTPLLKTEKKTSLETFGSYIHTYKFNEAVEDKVVLDLRYEARNVEQYLGNKNKIDEWFEKRTLGLSNVASAILKQRWARMEKLFSSKERVQRIVADICQDMDTKRALTGGYGNAMLVADSIYQACRYWEVFQETTLKGYCAVVTSYGAELSDIKGECVGEGKTEEEFKFDIYKKILDDKTPEQYEEWAKKEFIENPASMKLLIVVDKLLTGFDAPSATYLYIDKNMVNHNLFQAICRVNRVNGEEKDYGYIIDYQDLFNSIACSIKDYTTEAFEEYDQEDIQGLLTDRLQEGRKALEDALQAVVTLCEVVYPQTREKFFEYFVYSESTPYELQSQEREDNAEKRDKLYKLVSNLVRKYIDIANDIYTAGFTQDEAAKIKEQVDSFNDLKDEIKLKSGDAIDLKMYDPAMRQLIDAYVRADDSEELLVFNDTSFLDLVAIAGENAFGKLPKGIRNNPRSIAETLQANMRKVFIYERPNNPAYYDKLSDILQKLINEVKQGKTDYKEHIKKLIELVQSNKNKTQFTYPEKIRTDAQKALYDNLDKDEELTLAVHNSILTNAMDGWKDGIPPTKTKKVRRAIAKAMMLQENDGKVTDILNIAKVQEEY
nr:HsdR family type I site-specific deoxyribonuclease [Bacteroides intestinalis]